MMRLYLSGRITGCKDYKEIFASARRKLQNADYTVIDPTCLDLPEDTPWDEAMKIAIRWMLQCDGVAMLDNWQKSKGSMIEVQLARELGMKAKPVSVWLKTAG